LNLGIGAVGVEASTATENMEIITAVGRLATVVANHAEINQYKRAALFSISADVVRIMNDSFVLINGKATVDGCAWMSLDAINFLTNVWNATEKAIEQEQSLVEPVKEPVIPVEPATPASSVVEETKQPEITVKSVEFLPVPPQPAQQPAQEPKGKKKKKDKKKNQPQVVLPVVREPLKVIIDVEQHVPASIPVVTPESVVIQLPGSEEIEIINRADALAWEYITPLIETAAAIGVALENGTTKDAKYRRLFFQRIGLYARVLSEYYGKNKGTTKARVFMAIGVCSVLKLMQDFVSGNNRGRKYKNAPWTNWMLNN
jgi:hypothetical protein